MSWRKSLWLMAFVALAVALVAPPAGAVGNRITPQVFYPEKVDVSAPLRNMPIPPLRPLPPRERVQPGEKTIPPMAPTLDPVLQHVMGTGNMPAPFVSFDGLADADNGAVVGGYLTPADTEGAVGGNSPASNVYIQWVNLVWAVYDKTTGAQTAGPFPGNLFWSGFGGSCENSNNGDPIILYDKLADRWFVAQFAVDSSPYYECVAVSTSPDPLGTYYRYAVNTGGIFPDYPKFSVWADAYYGTVNQFNGGSGAGFMALERAKMLAGDPTAALIYFNLGAPYGNDLPVDFDGTAPGAGTPGIFAEVDKQAWIPGLTSDSLLIWYLTPDFTNPANSCLGASCTGAPNEIVPVATFTAPLCGGSRNCIPQPPGGEGLDSISDRIMYRAQGRDMVDHLSLVINHTVDAGGGIAGVRWYELRSSGGWNNWSMYQQGTYSPDSLHRWMGSIAMDHTGDIALGYSVSSSSVYTSVRYAGRLPGDPLGTLPQAEGELVAGDGVTNTGYNRWGDYSAMQVDPTDDCTFWYTQMYDRADDNTGPYPGWMWNTRIGSFKFDSCSIGPTGTLTGTVINAYTSDPVPGVLVTAGASSTLTNGSGVYTMTLPVGTYDMTASKFGFEPGSATGVPVTEGETTVQDFALTPTGNSWVDGYVTDFGHGWPLYASIAITAPPSFSTTIYTDPFTGYYSIQLDNGYNYTFTVNAVTPGYVGQVRPVSVTGIDQSQNFVLSPVVPDCTVPGYVPPELPPPDVAQNFDGVTPPAIPSGWANYSFS
ncbi:MAG: carboxypeptidase regulatory-like domain-containing protein, partial [Acidobacteriota bacterium]